MIIKGDLRKIVKKPARLRKLLEVFGEGVSHSVTEDDRLATWTIIATKYGVRMGKRAYRDGAAMMASAAAEFWPMVDERDRWRFRGRNYDLLEKRNAGK